MNYQVFERRAREAYEEIPEAYLEGIDGLVVSREAVPHPTLPDIYTMGQCLTEEHPSDFGGPDTTRSVITLYWGSFQALARLDPDFDWEGELWETLTHELRHHLESLAGDDALEDVDYAADELFNREEGLDFDPWYYQRGEDLGGGVFEVEGRLHVEQTWTVERFATATALDVTLGGRTYRVPKPEALGDVHFVWLEGLDVDAPVELVLVRRRGWLDGLRRVLGGGRTEVLESEARAEPVRPA